MRHALLLFTSLLCSASLLSQATTSERATKDAVHRIVRHSGLQPNFVVREDPGIPTAIAYIKDKQRVLA